MSVSRKFPSYRSLATDHRPLATHFSATLSGIGYFEKKPTLAVAVSGGADSMALLLLANSWAKERGGRAVALTVDHGLRTESASEARQVGTWCKAHGIEHHVLEWKSPKPSSAIQAKARDARYALLTAWCREHKLLHLLTAHHLSDQAETLLLRMARGSFIEGLSCMPAVSFRDGVRLLRPLLDVTKSELVDFLGAKNQRWIEDPSNRNPHYTRNRIRPHIGNDVARKASDLTARLGVIRNGLEHRLAAAMVRTVDIYHHHAVLKMAAFRALTEMQAMRLLSALLQALADLPAPPRSEQVALLYKDLTAPVPIKRRALAGCQFHYLAKYGHYRVESPPAAPHMKKTRTTAKPLAGGAFLGLNGERKDV